MIKYRPIQQTITNLSRYQPTEEIEVLIVQYDDRDKNILIPSSLTNFIIQYYSSSELNTKLTNAQIVCTFINYLNEKYC